MCRLGNTLYSWQDAAPVVMGVLAFGGDWQHLLPADKGVPVAVPFTDAKDPSKEARKVGS